MYFELGRVFFTGRFRIVLVFAILTIAPLISESLLSNTRVIMLPLECAYDNTKINEIEKKISDVIMMNILLLPNLIS